ncbi:MAG: hypothetical protein ACOC22_02960 [bacterium]
MNKDLRKGHVYKAHIHLGDETVETDFVVLGRQDNTICTLNLTELALDKEDKALFIEYLLGNSGYETIDFLDGKYFDDRMIPQDVAQCIDEAIILYVYNPETGKYETERGSGVEILEDKGHF